MQKVRVVGLNAKFFDEHDLYNIDDEIMPNETSGHKRPYVVIIKLNFKGSKQDFAVPFRSNISGSNDNANYFALPPRKETRKFHRHGLHFIKMLPIEKEYFEKYNYPTNNASASRTIAYIQKNFKRLVQEAQSYIDSFSRGHRPPLCVDIDKIYDAIKLSKPEFAEKSADKLISGESSDVQDSIAINEPQGK